MPSIVCASVEWKYFYFFMPMMFEQELELSRSGQCN